MIGNMRIEMIKRGFQSNSWSKIVRFFSDNLSVFSKPYKDYHASSSNDRKQSGDDRRKSTGSVREEVNPIKCKFYKSAGDESSVERREFEIWNGSIPEQIRPSDIYVR